MGGIVWCGDPAGINIGSCVETVTDNWERSPASHQLLVLPPEKEEEDILDLEI